MPFVNTLEEREDWEMLKHADNPRGILSISGLNPLYIGTPAEAAHSRGVDRGWFRLVDVNTTGRLFQLTARGRQRLAALKEKFK